MEGLRGWCDGCHCESVKVDIGGERSDGWEEGVPRGKKCIVRVLKRVCALWRKMKWMIEWIRFGIRWRTAHMTEEERTGGRDIHFVLEEWFGNDNRWEREREIVLCMWNTPEMKCACSVLEDKHDLWNWIENSRQWRREKRTDRGQTKEKGKGTDGERREDGQLGVRSHFVANDVFVSPFHQLQNQQSILLMMLTRVHNSRKHTHTHTAKKKRETAEKFSCCWADRQA